MISLLLLLISCTSLDLFTSRRQAHRAQVAQNQKLQRTNEALTKLLARLAPERAVGAGIHRRDSDDVDWHDSAEKDQETKVGSEDYEENPCENRGYTSCVNQFWAECEWFNYDCHPRSEKQLAASRKAFQAEKNQETKVGSEDYEENPCENRGYTSCVNQFWAECEWFNYDCHPRSEKSLAASRKASQAGKDQETKVGSEDYEENPCENRGYTSCVNQFWAECEWFNYDCHPRSEKQLAVSRKASQERAVGIGIRRRDSYDSEEPDQESKVGSEDYEDNPCENRGYTSCVNHFWAECEWFNYDCHPRSQ